MNAATAGEAPPGVSPALVAALTPARALSQSAIEALMRFLAQKLYWRLETIDWRVVHRTFHKCVAEKDDRKFVALVGADAPFIALSRFREDDWGWSFFDDPGVALAMRDYYGPSLIVLDAAQLSADLTVRDRAWLTSLGKTMQYNLRYWNPGTVGGVVFNFWD